MISVKNHHITAIVRVDIDWKNITALPKEGADAEPEGVRDRPDIGCRSLAIIVPLIRGDPRQTEEGDRQGQVRCCGVDPHLDRKWLEEGKWVWGRWSLLLVEDSHPCAHEGHGEVDGSLPDGGDRHVDHRHVRLLRPQLRDHASPSSIF